MIGVCFLNIPRFLVRIVAWYVFLSHRSSRRHFAEGLFVLSVFVSSGSLLCGSLLVPLLPLRRFLRISYHIACVSISLFLLHILAPRWNFLLIPRAALVGLLLGGCLRAAPLHSPPPASVFIDLARLAIPCHLYCFHFCLSWFCCFLACSRCPCR